MAAADKGPDAGPTPAGPLYQKFARDIFTITVSTALTAPTVFIIPLITRTLGAHDYGIWAQSLVTVSLFTGVAGLGLPYALTRFIPAKTNKAEIRDDFYSVVCLTFAVMLVLSAIIVAAASPIAAVFFDGASDVVRITALIMLVFSCTALYMALLRAFRSMTTYGLFMLLDSYGQVGLVAYLLLRGHGLLSVFYATAVMKSLILLCLLVYFGWRIGIARPRFIRIREYLRFGTPTVVTNASWWVVQSSDRYVIAAFVSATEVGIYSAGYSLGNVFYGVIGMLALVMQPTFSKLYDEGKRAELGVHMSYSLKYLLLLGIPFVVGATILAEPILNVLSTAEIASRGYYVVPLVALSIVLYAVNVMVEFPLALAKKTHVGAIAWGIAAAMNLGLNVLLVPRFGIAAAAATTLAAYALALSITAYYSVREFTIPVDWRSVAKSLAAAGVMAVAVWLIHPSATVWTILAVLVGVAVYALVLLLLKGIRRDEIAFIKDLLRYRGTSSGDDQR